jgi:type IV secretion system protein TrbI
MTEQTHNNATQIPEVRDRRLEPQGVVPKQSQAYVIVGVTIIILLAVLFSNRRAKPAKSATLPPAWAEPAPANNQAAIQQFEHELTEQQQQARQQQLQSAKSPTPTATDRENPAAATPGNSETQHDPIADAERALKFKAHFESNLVVAGNGATHRENEQPPSPQEMPDHSPVADAKNTAANHPAEINVNSAVGQPYAVFEGTSVDTVLVNRLDGDFSGPVKVMVTNSVYSQDRQHVLIPQGTFVLGEVQKVAGLGQRRLAVVFHRMIMPDGYSVDLDRFHGLDQAGQTGIADQVNHHYVQIFGASIALGVIAGAAESTTSTGLVESGSDALRQGMASSLAQSGAHVLDRFLNILPEITIREGHRIKVYFTEDLLLPAYENHRMPADL